MDCIIPDCLFLGPQEAAADWDQLRAHGITHILVCGAEQELHFPDDFTYHKLHVYDNAETSIISYFTECIGYLLYRFEEGSGVGTLCNGYLQICRGCGGILDENPEDVT